MTPAPAERRTGELLKDLARADTPNSQGANQHKVASKAATQPPPSPYAETLQRTGISRQTAHRYQALANVPAETFEAAMREPDKPTISGVLAKHEAQRAVQQARDPAPQMPAEMGEGWPSCSRVRRRQDLTPGAELPRGIKPWPRPA